MTSVITIRAFVDIITCDTITFESIFTITFKTTIDITACGKDRAIIFFASTFIFIMTDKSITFETRKTST